MKKSNIFAYIELQKLVDELQQATATGKLKEKLKTQAAYFNIIEPRHFSEPLIPAWEAILAASKQKGPAVDQEGNVISNAVSNTIEGFTGKECQSLADQVYALFEKVKQEFQ
jgi:hypothetical protein